jgi:muramoyltetrapeptide carboxypeptidase
MKARTRIGIIAPSSAVPQVELALGAAELRAAGFAPRVHSQCRQSHLFFAGNDEERARAFFELARDPAIDALWCARGGYGAVRLVPWLDRLTRKHGKPPRKLLAGYSDALVLNDYVRERWGWRAVHAAMPGMREFLRMTPGDRAATYALVRGDEVELQAKLRFASGHAAKRDVVAPLVGGNLCVLASVVGTPAFPKLKGKILFLEEVDEALYRIDRMIQQLIFSGTLKGVRAIVLGEFANCPDRVAKALRRAPETEADLKRVIQSPRPEDLMPLRETIDEARGIPQLFGQLAAHYRVPLALGFPGGHGDRKFPLLLGGRYRLDKSARLTLEG